MNSDEKIEDPSLLLNNFEKLLESDPRTITLEEDEWAELADLAMDADNQFLFFQAVLWGLRAYPESEQLRDREAIFTAEILDLTESPDVFKTLSRRPYASRLSKLYLLDFSNKIKNPASFYKSIKQLMLSDTLIADHEVIELVRILVDNDCLEYLIEELELWEKSVDNKEILWYEIAEDAFEAFYYEPGLEIVAKLNNSYPYNPDYWVLKARLLNGLIMENIFDADVTHFAELGLDAVETALAIDPKHSEALKLHQFFSKSGKGTTEKQKEFSDTTIVLLEQAISKDDKEKVRELLEIIPQAWFFRNMKDYLYLSIQEVGNSKSEEILNSWIEYELALKDNPAIVNRVYNINNGPLVAIANRFGIHFDLESLEELYDRAEKICKPKRIENPVAIAYAFVLLFRNKKSKFNSVFKNLELQTSRDDLNFALLSFAKDLSENKKQMITDSNTYIFNLLEEEIRAVMTLKGAIGYNAVQPVCIRYFTSLLVNK